MSSRITPLRHFVQIGAIVLALVGFVLVASPATADTAPTNPADPATPPTVSADALPTVQIDGVVWSQVVVGDIVYAAGDFDNARPAGSPAGVNSTPRGNLLAYNITTGALVTSFAPTLNAQAKVVTASPDGSRIYVGGSFTVANGQPRHRVAAYSTATGALITSYRSDVSSTVNAIAVTDTTVYVGGNFTNIKGQPRTRVAAFNAANGALLPFAPNVDWRVNAMVLTDGGSQLVIGGAFTKVNGVINRSVAALDAATGATRPFAISALLRNTGDTAAVLSLSTDGDTVYGTGYTFGPGNFEGVFAANTAGGTVRWIADCLGDHYSVFSTGSAVYSSAHSHDCGAMRAYPEPPGPRHWHYAAAFSKTATTTNIGGRFPGQPAPTLQAWDPVFVPGNFTQQYQAGWSVTGNSDYVVYGGEFLKVNGTNQQGLVRFARSGLAPNLQGPVATAEHDRGVTPLTPTLTNPSGGTVRVAWRTTHDPDNENLIYRIVRGGVTVHERTVASKFWTLTDQTFDNTGLPGGTYSYQVVAVDPFGNQRASETRQITIGGPPNTAPTASFTSSTEDLTASFDGSGSSDPGGSIVNYAWEFGDGTTGTGVTTSRTYGVAGTYTVRLTVTDNFGATGTTTRSVTVSLPVGAPIATDAFGRTLAPGLGSADVGGPYTVLGGSSSYSVNGLTGQLRTNAGSTLQGSLNSVSAQDVAVQVAVVLDRPVTGGGMWVSVIARSLGSDDYRVRAKVTSTGVVNLTIARVIGGAYTTLQSLNIPGLTYTAGAVLNIRLDVSGNGTTTVQAKAWLSTQAEPPAFHVSATDATASMQRAGAIGIGTYLSGSATNAPITASFDNLWAGAAGSAPPV